MIGVCKAIPVICNLTIYTYGKCPKILNTLFHTILAKILLFMQLFLKILNRMANSVDPDQEQSDLGLFCLHMSFCQIL